MGQTARHGNDENRLENVRGPQLTLPPHPQGCGHADLAAYHREFSGQPLAVDLFSGAGGLSLGLQKAGFRLALAVDSNRFAVETHAAHFPGASIVSDIALEATLDEILEPLRGRRIDLLAGGPPCQPFSIAARWRRSVSSDGMGSLRDHRRELWRSFIYAADLLRPKAVLIENVPDLAMNEDAIILRAVFSRLEELGYSVDCRSYFAYDLGVPQYRQRIFIVGFRHSARLLDWPAPAVRKDRPTLKDAISDLPPLRGGWNEQVSGYAGPRTPLQRMLRDGLPEEDLSLHDHVTRAVRQDDSNAFRLLTHKTRYNELPTDLRRYGTASFLDKYNRLSWDEPCRSITAHLGRDGYWYIHPDQHRSLSIREAARVQSFPDWFRFAGFLTSAFRQIGEAVPPLVSEALGRRIIGHLEPPSAANPKKSKTSRLDRHFQIRELLRAWYESEARKNSLRPWRHEPDLWINLMGDVLFDERGQHSKALLFWDNYKRDWPTPRSLLKDRHRESHLRTIGLSKKLTVLEPLARYMVSVRVPTAKDIAALGINERLARRAMALAGYSHERPNDPALVRVANRLFKRKASRKSSVESQIATAMLVGEDEGVSLYLAAIELGESLCASSDPACLLCPLAKHCSHYGERG
jgi:DNA (cytosine-5)-methyltransferase 1